MDPPSTSKANTTTTSKPKIDPLQLLRCLSILLNSKGGIKGKLEVPRIEGLMAKYSKKLVSKCIYLNILQATDVDLLDEFYDEGGWELVGDWLQDAVSACNWPLTAQVLSLLDSSPMTITRLKRYTTPKLIKELSKECNSPDVQSFAKHILVKWMDIVRENDSLGTAVGMSNAIVNDDGTSPKGDEEVAAKSVNEATRNGGINQGLVDSAGAPGNADSSQDCGDGSSSLEGQDDSSNTSTESDDPPAPTTPIRITIRSGSQVLAKVSSERYSMDSNDSDDNKPLSVLKKEVEKAKIETPKGSIGSSMLNSEETYIPPASDPVSPERNSSNSFAAPNTTVSVSSNSSVVTVSDSSSSPESSNSAVNTTPAAPTMLTFSTTTGGLSTSTTPPAAEETPSAMDTNSEPNNTETNNNQQASSGSEEKDNLSSDKIGDEENKEDTTDSKLEKDKSKEKEKIRDSEKKDKKDREKDKDKKHKDDKKKEKERESSKSSKSSSSSSSRSRERRNSKDSDKSDRSKSDKEKSSSSHSKGSSKDKDKDRSKSSSRDKDRKGSSSSSSRDKSRDKDHKHDDKKKKEQENEDKATLEKVKPLSADGLGKIPRKTQPSSFLDALGSADMDVEAKKPSVKTYKSRGFRSTGLLDEPTKPPGKKGPGNGTSEKKTSAATAGSQGVKRPSPLDELVASLPDKRIKSSVSSMPSTSDKPGGVKLISPKRPSLADDGGFMAALTASGPDRKKVTRKRRSSEGDSKDSKAEGKDEEKNDEKSPTSSPTKGDDKGILSPTSVKPTFNFYQETLKDEPENEEKEGESKEEGDENGDDVEMKEEGKTAATEDDDDNMDIEENIKDEDIPIAPALPAPAQEDYEKVEVIFSDPVQTELRGVLVYHRTENRKKKAVKWKTDEVLKEVFYFEMDETERVNVNANKFGEMMALEKQEERKFMGKNRDMHRIMMGGQINSIGMGMPHENHNVIEYMRWTLLSITIPNQSKVVPGYNSKERKIQAARESSTIPAFYHPAMLPETPSEPDPEMVTRVEPKEIPVTDVTGQDIVYDHRGKMWPEPMYGEPPVSYGYGGMGGGGPPLPPPPSSGGGGDGGSHWVVGGPPSGGFPGPAGPPMYNGPGGYGGPNMGGPNMGGPGNYGGDMGGGMDMQGGWGGPPPGPGPGPGPGPVLGPGPGGMPYPNQDMMMGGNNHGMMMGGGGGGRPGGPPRNMMPPNMGMGGGQNYRGGRGGPGGNWGPGPSRTPVCKHHLNGHCRHGKNCRFLHSRH